VTCSCSWTVPSILRPEALLNTSSQQLDWGVFRGALYTLAQRMKYQSREDRRQRCHLAYGVGYALLAESGCPPPQATTVPFRQSSNANLITDLIHASRLTSAGC
jgi:hypothetical protein